MTEPGAKVDRKGQMITPATARPGQPASGTETQGYALHTGEARSTEDVTIRNGTAPILERGQGDDNEIEEVLADSIPAANNAPD
jgi:hypothetical protein